MRARLALTVVVVAFLSGEPSQGRARDGERCSPRSSVPVAGSGQVRVYRGRSAVTACVLSTGRRYRLGRWKAAADRPYVARVMVGGRHVLFVRAREALSSQGPYSPDRLVLLDTKGGRRAKPVTGCSSDPNPNAEDALRIPSLAVTGRGAIGWICHRSEGGLGYSEVHLVESGQASVLDTDAGASGDPIDPWSLAMVDRRRDGGGPLRVYWQRRSGPRSAAVP